MKKQLFLPAILGAALFFACEAATKQSPSIGLPGMNRNAFIDDSIPVYQSNNLIVLQLTGHIYQHISFMQTNDFGKVDCNGMIAVNDHEAVVFDSPANDESAEELINFLTQQRKYRIKAVIPTHFHEDCVGGLEAFNKHHIPAYASNATLFLLKNKGKQFSVPIHGFKDSIFFNIGGKKVYAKYFGEGHTKDNIIGYFPDDKAVFGGCLIKETGAGKGYLEDANTSAWPQTVSRLQQAYPETRIVIPGHGKSGGIELLDYTIRLFK